jgi:hypothetical protein
LIMLLPLRFSECRISVSDLLLNPETAALGVKRMRPVGYTKEICGAEPRFWPVRTRGKCPLSRYFALGMDGCLLGVTDKSPRLRYESGSVGSLIRPSRRAFICQRCHGAEQRWR